MEFKKGWMHNLLFHVYTYTCILSNLKEYIVTRKKNLIIVLSQQLNSMQPNCHKGFFLSVFMSINVNNDEYEGTKWIVDFNIKETTNNLEITRLDLRLVSVSKIRWKINAKSWSII